MRTERLLLLLAALAANACSSDPAPGENTGGTGNTGSGGKAPATTGGAPAMTGGSGGTTSTGGMPGSGGAGPSGGSPATGGSGGSGGAGAPAVGGGGGAGGAGGAGAAGGTPAAGGQAVTGGMPGASGMMTGGDSGSGTGGAGVSGMGGSAGSGEATKWVGTWATGNQVTEPDNLPPSPGLANNTLRQIVHVSIGGSKLRLKLSNEYGSSAVAITAVHVAKQMSGSTIDTASDKALTFGGMANVSIPAKMAVTSDEFDFDLAPLSNVAITIAFGAQSGDVTGHPGSRTTSFIQSGNQVGAATVSGAMTDHWYFISSIDVLAPESSAAIAILGDSITDGRGSTTNMNDRWPDALAKRLQGNAATKGVAVLNLGIGGNAVTSGGLGPTATARFDSQILGQAGVKWVIVLEGINDIGGGASANSLTNAFQQFIDKSHAKDLLIYGIPLLPFGGSSYDSGNASSTAATVNDWIRAAGHFDASFPCDTAVGNGGNPPQLQSAYDSGDKLHLSPAGYQKVADAIDLVKFAP
jgi:lysophospholipase L1-like esterase